ncbi:MAG: TonB family protein [Prevotellaceae bacterium]|nr:TonB family protein [Prevotellaceae bacterium]
MHDDELLSRRWCELVFEGRNKDYGAYALRSRAGRRYAAALGAVAGGVLLMVLVPLLVVLYVDWRMASDRPDLSVLDELRRFEAREGHELRAVAAGRHVPKAPPAPETATGEVPRVAEDDRFRTIGADRPNENAATERQSMDNLPDSAHNADRDDLPEEGRLLTPAEIVSEMPEFPGGLAALMKWLDKEIVSPRQPRKGPAQGTVEVSFIVDEAGIIHDIRISRSLGADYDRVVLQAVGRMPRWKPGRIGGKARAAQVTIPVEFHAQ